MGTPKEEVRRLLEKLPEDCSLEDIQYHIYVRQKVERGLRDVEEGRTLTQEEVERRQVQVLALIHGHRDLRRAWRDRG